MQIRATKVFAKELSKRLKGNYCIESVELAKIPRDRAYLTIGGGYSDVDIDWKTWSEGNDFALGKLKEHFDFKLKDSAKILEIKDIKDLDKLPRISDRSQLKQYIESIDNMNSDIDFEELAKEYDGIMVWMYRSKDIDKETRMFDGMYYRMYGWDVDTLVVFNPDVIEEVDA